MTYRFFIDLAADLLVQDLPFFGLEFFITQDALLFEIGQSFQLVHAVGRSGSWGRRGCYPGGQGGDR